jgi:hypothetical protein
MVPEPAFTPIDGGAAPNIAVRHQEVLQVSKQPAFNWCYTPDGPDSGTSVGDEDDDFVNPDSIVANEANSPPNNPTWSGATIDERSSQASWALFQPTGSALLSANAQMEHRSVISGETDTTFSHGPATSYSTSADTTEEGQVFTFTVPLGAVTMEVWSYNTVTGLPGALVDSGATVGFTAGGSSLSTRHRLLLFRAPVPQNALTLRTPTVLNGQLATLGFNDTCTARNSANTLVSQMFALPANRWVIVDASLPSGAEPTPPRRLLWVKSGGFSECRGTSTTDCRYGRYFDDYLDASVAFPSSRTVAAKGQIGGVSGAPMQTLTAHTVPQGETRALAQEP